MKIAFLWGAKRTLWKMHILKGIWTLKDFVMGKLFSGTFFPFSCNLKYCYFGILPAWQKTLYVAIVNTPLCIYPYWIFVSLPSTPASWNGDSTVYLVLWARKSWHTSGVSSSKNAAEWRLESSVFAIASVWGRAQVDPSSRSSANENPCISRGSASSCPFKTAQGLVPVGVAGNFHNVATEDGYAPFHLQQKTLNCLNLPEREFSHAQQCCWEGLQKKQRNNLTLVCPTAMSVSC